MSESKTSLTLPASGAVTRFAPSPTGAVHLGNVRTALFSALLAHKSGGRFLLRIEDTDLERSTEAHFNALLEDLKWLGMDWDAGPDKEDAGAPYRQSARGAVYAHYFVQLEAQGMGYPCFCTPLELDVARRSQLAAGRPPRYLGTCRNLSAGQRAERVAKGLKPTLRFRVPDGRELAFEDFVRGPQKFATDDIGDFIVRRADGNPAFFFCNAVDDALQGVTHVLRGEDHLTNTPRQIMILEALQLRVPAYGHVAMIVGADGAPLSKRHGSVSVREFRARGFLPEALMNHLFRLGHSTDHDGWLELAQMPEHFRVEHLGRAPARFDEVQLMHWQKEALARADAARVAGWLQPALPAGLSAEQLALFVELVRHNVLLPEDARPWVAVLFGDLPPLAETEQQILSEAGAGFFSAARSAAEHHGADLPALVKAVQAATGRKGAALYKPLRIALTGRSDGPELGPLLKALPPGKASARFAQFAG